MLELKGLKKVFGGITVLNDIDISLFSTRKLDNNILERWLFYFKSFSAKEPKNNKETRTALIGDENVTFVSNSSTWSDSNLSLIHI